MDNVENRILAEIDYIKIALSNLNEAREREEKTNVELLAIGASLHSIYNGIENIIKQVLRDKNIEISETPSWHKDLLDSSVTNSLFSKELVDQLYAYLTFRHFFVHTYGFMLQEEKISGLANTIESVWTAFLAELNLLYKIQ